MVIAYNRYAISNIPVEFWNFDMKDFEGPEDLKSIYADIIDYNPLTKIDNLSKMYKEGVSICLAGTSGVGKTTTASCILKKASQRNYECLYTDMSNIVNALIESPMEEKFYARKELTMVDFLVLDEFDPRFIPIAAADLFGKILENIMRARFQNKLPTIICTNSPNPVEAFNGSFKQSIESLFYKIKIIPIIGEDFRKKMAK
jgi:DNA replication protein DnaC